MNRMVILLVSILTLGTAMSADAVPRLTTDKRAVPIGATVRFTLMNDTRQMMAWSAICDYPTVWRLLPDGAEEIVREQVLCLLDAIGTLEPDGKRVWEWDQRDYHQWYDNRVPPIVGKQVPAGRYVARFSTMTHGDFESPTFTIGNALAVDRRGKLTTAWASMKRAR